MEIFSTFDEAYRQVLSDVLSEEGLVDGVTDELSVGSEFGASVRRTKEIIGHTFTINDPRARFTASGVRSASLAFSIANFLWVSRGIVDMSPVLFYNPKGAKFSSEGSTLETAFGPRIFGDQGTLEIAISLLENDPSTRRAYVPILQASDVLNRSKDVPCAAGLHFLVRDDTLILVTHMRSQSAAMVLPYDVFLFTMIQELVSSRLKCRLGPYVHISNSIHIYEDEFELAESIIGAGKNHKIEKMKEMPHEAAIDLENVLLCEEAIRNCDRLSEYENLRFERCHPYWHDLLGILRDYAISKEKPH